ncbi:hypothetical protein KMW28_03610 [Flammeovirga yaeyamensis]|uniref:Uncharacterized protein n=1 Tax=Flammeovirga yaeyamensis TaxID=367791 RepID=A0AAX1N8X8_9BACT|nr:hypothetical protein [Flammeovirga yaeyamensis]MBB3701266.1 hypothetical protein [Flammeovirga yaeyamensis]NMF38264.1 hypothetical protein [Flammeovirga yaeyamensis]QWG02675.1 hypothetical protein KMW28_03610 [Flammeovirga yaeyamensis]
MPRQKFYLDTEKKEQLVVEFKPFFKNAKVTLNGNEILQFQDKKDVKSGGEYQIDNDRKLSIQLVRNKLMGTDELVVLVNNEPVKGSSSDPYYELKTAYSILFLLAGLNIFFGIIAEVTSMEILVNLGLGIGSIIVGAFYVALGYVIKVKRSMIALGVSIFFILLDVVLTIYFMPGKSIGGLIFKAFLSISLFRGFGAIKKIKQKEAEESNEESMHLNH